MNVFIMRHGEAASQAPQDSLRELTPQGGEEVKHSADWLSHKVNSLDLVLVSPYVRAQQSWQVLSETLQSHQVRTNKHITPYASASLARQEIDDALVEFPALSSLLLVSHMPLVSFLVQELTGEVGPLFSTAAVAHIDYTPSRYCGRLLAVHQGH